MRWLDCHGHTWRAVCCQNWCKRISWCADSSPGVSGLTEEVTLSPAWHSLVSLAHCISYDGFSFLFPRQGLCFLFKCIPHGQRMVLWHWTQGQATVENESTLLPQVSHAFFSHSMCGLSQVSASCFPAGLLSLSFCLAGGVGKNNGTEQSEGSKTLAWSALAFRLSSALLQSLQGLFLKRVSQDSVHCYW